MRHMFPDRNLAGDEHPGAPWEACEKHQEVESITKNHGISWGRALRDPKIGSLIPALSIVDEIDKLMFYCGLFMLFLSFFLCFKIVPPELEIFGSTEWLLFLRISSSFMELSDIPLASCWGKAVVIRNWIGLRLGSSHWLGNTLQGCEIPQLFWKKPSNSGRVGEATRVTSHLTGWPHRLADLLSPWPKRPPKNGSNPKFQPSGCGVPMVTWSVSSFHFHAFEV